MTKKTECILCHTNKYGKGGVCLICPPGHEPNTHAPADQRLFIDRRGATGCKPCTGVLVGNNGTCNKSCGLGTIVNSDRSDCIDDPNYRR